MRADHQNQARGPPEHGPLLTAQVVNLALQVMTSILDSHLENHLKNKWITVGRRRGDRRGYRKMTLVFQASFDEGPNHICRWDEEKYFMLK